MLLKKLCLIFAILSLFSCYLYLYEYGGRRLQKHVRVNKTFMSTKIYCLVVSVIAFSTSKQTMKENKKM